MLCQRNDGPGEMLVHIKVEEQDLNLFAREIATWLLAFRLGLYPLEINFHKIVDQTI